MIPGGPLNKMVPLTEDHVGGGGGGGGIWGGGGDGGCTGTPDSSRTNMSVPNDPTKVMLSGPYHVCSQ